ncbi:hypothetical protein RRF57_012170 [Xylaria bambusicola]|uniref:Uncharacterized protein n=1 Tax=Xylaria bambusicola TaxID=326684 RepID=A0AAN7ZEK0_9PEZI
MSNTRPLPASRHGEWTMPMSWDPLYTLDLVASASSLTIPKFNSAIASQDAVNPNNMGESETTTTTRVAEEKTVKKTVEHLSMWEMDGKYSVRII